MTSIPRAPHMPLGYWGWLAGLVVVFLLLMTPAAPPSTYYVSTSGNDGNPGTAALPFRTIQKAATVMRAGDDCLIREGIYRETVRPANSGAAGAPISFEAYPDEHVVVSGAEIVSGFTRYRDRIYRAPMPLDLGPGLNQVFANGAILPEARYPDTASPEAAYPVAVGPLWPLLGTFSVPEGTTDKVISDLLRNQPVDLWRGALYIGTHYYAYQTQIATVVHSFSGHLIVSPLSMKWYHSYDPYFLKIGGSEAGRGYLSGVMGALDLPGEWVVQDGQLYLMASGDEGPDSLKIEAKARQLAFNLSGRSYIDIRNLEVAAASLIMDHRSSHNTLDRLRFTTISQNNRVSPYHRSNLNANRGENGVFVGGWFNSIINSLFSNATGPCLWLTGLDHRVTNNVIRDCGSATGASNVEIGPDFAAEAGTSDRGGHEISFNTVYNSGRSAISLGRDVDYYLQTGRGQPTPFRKIWIHHNELYNGNLLAKDSGLFYTFGCAGGTAADPGEIAYNVIHHNLEPGGLGWGVYLDEGSYHFNVHHNVIWLGREGGRRDAVFFHFPAGENGSRINGGDSFAHDNIYKSGYTGGSEGLSDEDFPGGRFTFGANQGRPPGRAQARLSVSTPARR